MKKYIYVIIVLIFISCNNKDVLINKTPLVKVYDKYLYLEELKNFPKNLSEEDSLLYLSEYIETWVKEQLLLLKAEKYLADEQEDINKKIADFRTSLFIHKYKNKFIAQKLDTIVAIQEIKDYYEQYSDELKLPKNAIQGYFIKISNKEPEIAILKNMLHSGKPSDLINIETFCTDKNTYYDNFNASWKYFSSILSKIPYEIESQDYFLQSYKYLETEDENYYYFLKINDYKLKNDVAPLIFYQDNIKSIILNKRSKLMIEELENTILDNAKNQIKYY